MAAVTAVVLERTGKLSSLIQLTGITPVTVPDHHDTDVLEAVRRRQTAVWKLTEASASASAEAEDVLNRAAAVLESGVNTLGGPTHRQDVRPTTPAHVLEEVKKAAKASAHDATHAESAALIRTLASLSLGLEQICLMLDRELPHD